MISHKGHDHAATAKARAACRKEATIANRPDTAELQSATRG